MNMYFQHQAQLRIHQQPVDITEARAAVFTEQQSFWPLPVYETAMITDIAVTPAQSQDPLDDRVHVATAAPAAVYSLVPRGDDPLSFVLLHDVLPRFRSSYQARLRLTEAPHGILIVHEESTNTLLRLDMHAGTVSKLQTGSLFESAAETVLKRLGSSQGRETFYRMCKDKAQESQIVLWEVGGGNVLFLDLLDESLHSLALPLTLSSFHMLSGGNQWLAVNNDGTKWLLKGDKEDSFPHLLHPVTQSDLEEPAGNGYLSRLSHLAPRNLSDFILSTALDQKISAPSRLIAPVNSLAAVSVGFPDLDASENDVYVWERPQQSSRRPHVTVDPASVTVVLDEVGQIIRVTDQVPSEALHSDTSPAGAGCYLEVTDIVNHSLSYVPVPRASHSAPYWTWNMSARTPPLLIARTSAQGIASVDSSGVVRLWQTGTTGLERALAEWRKMIGEDSGPLRLDVERMSGLDVSSPKHGKEDPDNEPHVGGNQWAGGTGGRDTAGLGGMGGPYRLDAGHDVYQVPQVEKDAVPEEVRRAAHEMAQKAFKERLKEIKMSEYDASLYERLAGGVQPQVRSLRGIISSLQARGKERQWIRHRTSGELDDTKLIEGLAGERNIYRQRREEEPEIGAPQSRPKQLRLLVDVSGSMYRFNGHDGRLERELEATLMVMEAFEGFENKFQYEIYGHSGEDVAVPLVDKNSVPRDNKQRLDVLKTMQAHSQFCLSGDHTLEAAKEAVTQIAKEETDESFVILLSDANLERYGIRPRELANALTAEPSVHTYAIFIGSLGDQAERLTKALPAGHSFVCMDLKKLPQILQQIFTSAMLK